MPHRASTEAPRITDAPSLIRAMHARHAGRWYRTLRFKQTVTWTEPDGSTRPPEVWVEHAAPPGRLRVDFGEMDSGDGVLYAEGRRHVFRRGDLVSAPMRRSPLLLLSFDVFAQPPERTLADLSEDGFDLSILRDDSWQCRAVHVVGATAGDLRARQFWIDRETLLVVRVVEPAPEDGSQTSDVRFGRYLPIGGGWVATEVVFLVEGAEVMREDYFDVEADVEFAPGLFDPARWSHSPA